MSRLHPYAPIRLNVCEIIAHGILILFYFYSAGDLRNKMERKYRLQQHLFHGPRLLKHINSKMRNESKGDKPGNQKEVTKQTKKEEKENATNKNLWTYTKTLCLTHPESASEINICGLYPKGCPWSILTYMGRQNNSIWEDKTIQRAVSSFQRARYADLARVITYWSYLLLRVRVPQRTAGLLLVRFLFFNSANPSLFPVAKCCSLKLTEGKEQNDTHTSQTLHLAYNLQYIPQFWDS